MIEVLESRLLLTAHHLHPISPFGHKPIPAHRPIHNPGIFLPGPEPAPSPAPAVPLEVTALATGSNEIDLSWSVDSSGATYTVVRRSGRANPGYMTPFVLIVVAQTTGSGWHDTGLPQDSTYQYTVSKSDGEVSPIVSATTWLAAPSNLTVSYVLPSTETFALSWRDNSLGLESGIEVDRQFDGGAWSVDVLLPPNSTSWTEDPCAITHEYGIYSYRVRALG